MRDTYISELRKKYTGFMVVKAIYLIHHIMDRYRKMTETDLEENRKVFDEILDTTMTIDKYFESIDNCIQYTYDAKQPYTDSQIINNAYSTVLATGLYMASRKICRKKPASEKNVVQLQEVLHRGLP